METSDLIYRITKCVIKLYDNGCDILDIHVHNNDKIKLVNHLNFIQYQGREDYKVDCKDLTIVINNIKLRIIDTIDDRFRSYVYGGSSTNKYVQNQGMFIDDYSTYEYQQG